VRTVAHTSESSFCRAAWAWSRLRRLTEAPVIGDRPKELARVVMVSLRRNDAAATDQVSQRRCANRVPGDRGGGRPMW
jgi:hypothetical protein